MRGFIFKLLLISIILTISFYVSKTYYNGSFWSKIISTAIFATISGISVGIIKQYLQSKNKTK